MPSGSERRPFAMRLRRALVAATALGFVAAPLRVTAQISPGPLSKAHAELEGVLKCLECHGIGEAKLDARCLECHVEIEWLRAQGRGLHGADGLGECATCHQEHGGKDFEIVHWGKRGYTSFDHRRAGWELRGRHREAECRTCHREEFHESAVMTLRDGGPGRATWLGLEVACASCHADPHAGRLGSDCAKCHTEHDFRKIIDTGFDHESTRYPLRGAHREVSCAGCHESEAGWIHQPASSNCASCHADPHQGLATIAGRRADCAQCHGVDRFRPSTFTVAMHADGPYPLEGRHVSAACEACHVTTKGDGVKLRMAHARCVDCHADPHGTQLAGRSDGGDCESCHLVEGFRPSTFAVADHQTLAFPLSGSHVEADCRSCHAPDRARPNSGRELGAAGVRFRFADTECRSCHVDPHRGRFAQDGERPASDGCLSCHDHDRFSPSHVNATVHATYAFPLEGAHAAIPCFECHRELEGDRLASTLIDAGATPHLGFEIRHRDCRDCHRDPHGGQFEDRGACSSCHGLDAWGPAARFDHERDAEFSLVGAHARTACQACHAPTVHADGSTSPRYRPVSRRCEDCHGPSPPLEEGTR